MVEMTAVALAPGCQATALVLQQHNTDSCTALAAAKLIPHHFYSKKLIEHLSMSQQSLWLLVQQAQVAAAPKKIGAALPNAQPGQVHTRSPALSIILILHVCT